MYWDNTPFPSVYSNDPFLFKTRSDFWDSEVKSFTLIVPSAFVKFWLSEPTSYLLLLDNETQHST